MDKKKKDITYGILLNKFFYYLFTKFFDNITSKMRI